MSVQAEKRLIVLAAGSRINPNRGLLAVLEERAGVVRFRATHNIIYIQAYGTFPFPSFLPTIRVACILIDCIARP